MTSKHERLLELYTQVLATVGIKPVDDLGKLSYISPVDPEDITPAAVKGKRLVLPTREALRLPEFWDNHCAFHPLSENFLNGESPVLSKLKAMINLKLGAVTAELMSWLVSYAADPERQNTGNVSAGASKYLKLVPNIKQVTADRFADIIKKSTGSNDKRFVNLYLRRGGDLLDSRYQWVCTATFPMRQELDGEDPKVFGVKISKKDQESLKALFDYILPDNDNIATYSAGSKIKSACKFDATLRAFANIAERLNEIITLHKKIIPSYKDLKIDIDWLLALPELDKLADVVPALPMNEGESMRDRRTDGAAVTVSTSEKARRVLTSTSLLEEPTDAPVRDEPRRAERPALVDAPAEPAKVTGSSSFGDRMAARHTHETSRGGYHPGAPNRNYGQPAAERIPEWSTAVAEGKGIKIAGDPDRQPYQSDQPQSYAAGGNNGYRSNNSHWGAQNERVRVMSSQGQVARGPARRQNQNFDL
jgi:hypothetical protein